MAKCRRQPRRKICLMISTARAKIWLGIPKDSALADFLSGKNPEIPEREIDEIRDQFKKKRAEVSSS